MENKEEMFQYLEALRASGVINMWGAGEYLQRDFDLKKNEARDVLLEWMKKPVYVTVRALD